MISGRLSGLVAASTGLTGITLVEALNQQSMSSWIAFTLSVASTVIGWLLARKSELAHAEMRLQAEAREQIRDQARLDAELARDVKMADLMAEMARHRFALAAEADKEPRCTTTTSSSSTSATP